MGPERIRSIATSADVDVTVARGEESPARAKYDDAEPHQVVERHAGDPRHDGMGSLVSGDGYRLNHKSVRKHRVSPYNANPSPRPSRRSSSDKLKLSTSLPSRNRSSALLKRFNQVLTTNARQRLPTIPSSLE